MQSHELGAVLALESVISGPPSKLSLQIKRPNAQVLVALNGSRIVGYLDYWMILDELEVMELGVSPDFRRQGIASALLQTMERDHPRARLIHLEVRSSNQGAIALYRKSGFAQTGFRQRYYSDGEDAITMSRTL